MTFKEFYAQKYPNLSHFWGDEYEVIIDVQLRVMDAMAEYIDMKLDNK